MKSKTQRLLELSNSDEKSSVSFAERRFSDNETAKHAFIKFKSLLFDLGLWNRCSAVIGFALYGENGAEINTQTIEKNLLLRLSMPGSGKYDWVKVTEIIDSPNEIVLTVQPSHDPTDKNNKRAKTSHFFVEASSNNFCLIRNENTVNFYIIGLCEIQNTSETQNYLETIRNVMTASVGSFLGIQKTQWTTFAENFLDQYEKPDES